MLAPWRYQDRLLENESGILGSLMFVHRNSAFWDEVNPIVLPVFCQMRSIKICRTAVIGRVSKADPEPDQPPDRGIQDNTL